MQKSIIIFWWTCTFLCAGFSTRAESREEGHDSLSIQRQLVEYERQVYRASTNAEHASAIVRKAGVYAEIENWEDALETILRVQYADLNDSMHYAVRYATAFYAYMNLDFEQASSQLVMINSFLPEPYPTQAALLHALVLNELGQWDEARAIVINRLTNGSIFTVRQRDSLLAMANELYNPKRFPKMKNPELASTLSMFAPGLGQLYAGYPADALFSSVMVLSGLGIAAYGIVVAGYYVTGPILGYIVVQRFIIAGIKRAEFLTAKRNDRKKRNFNQDLKGFVLGMG